MTDEIPFEHVTPQEARAAAKKHEPETPPPPDRDQTWGQYRTSAPEPQTTPNIKLLMPWIAALPANIRPHELIVQYPRVANHIAGLWRYPMACEKYLNSLMIDERGDRQGFPEAVAHELAALHVYFSTQVITQHFDEWGERIGD